MDLKGRIIDANQRACKNLGYAKEELLNLTIADIDCNAIKNSKDKLWPKVIAGETFAFESDQKRKDGSTFPVEVSLGPSTNGKETLVIGLIRDISERKKAESELKESEARHRVISGLIGDVAFSCLKSEGYNFVVDWITGAIEKVFGCSVEEIKKRGCWKFVVDPRDLPIFEEKIVGLSAGQSSTCELRVISRDGSIRWIRVFSRVEEDKKTPKSFRLFGVCEEISERKKLEVSIAEKLDALEALTGNIGAGFITISKDYRVLYANRFVKNKVGNVEGKRCYATLHDLDHICPDCGVRKVFEDGVDKDSHEYSQVGIDGKPFSVEIIATPLKDKEGNVTAALEIVVDLTEKKQMQQKLQTDEEKFKAISYSAMDAIFMFDEEDTITYWNPAAEGIFGYAEKEIVGQKVNATLVPPCHRKDHLKFTSELGKIENKQNLGGILEFPALRKDGEEFPMEISMAPLQLNHNLYFVAIARDVTDRKEAEEQLNLTMDQLVLVNEKLSVVGSLTRHDVRNKLSAANGYAYLLKKKHADQADIVDGLGKIEQAVRDSMKIFDFAKIYEQLGVEKLSYADVGKAVDEAAALFSGLTFKVVNDCHGRSVLADSFLRQMFFNFIDNTKKYGAKATTIKVYCAQEDSGGLRLVYEDDGVGISTENKPKLFKEGFSTGGSTGFGLFLIRKMMDVYGWTIIEEGKVGKGAKFVISIPASAVSGLAREPSA